MRIKEIKAEQFKNSYGKAEEIENLLEVIKENIMWHLPSSVDVEIGETVRITKAETERIILTSEKTIELLQKLITALKDEEQNTSRDTTLE